MITLTMSSNPSSVSETPVDFRVFFQDPVEYKSCLAHYPCSLICARVLLSNDIRITIFFDEEGMVRGSGGCNTFFGEYLISVEYQIFGKSEEGMEEQIGVGGTMPLESIAHTERACIEPGRM